MSGKADFSVDEWDLLRSAPLMASVLVVARAEDDRDNADLHSKLSRARLPHLLLNRDRMLHIVLPEAAVAVHPIAAFAAPVLIPEAPENFEAGGAQVTYKVALVVERLA